MKDIQYLTHDLGARNDPKLMDLQMDMGGKGLGIFWCLVELLWENGGYIPANYKSIAFALRWCTAGEVEKVVTNYGLFQVEEGMITSRSARERINQKQEKYARISNARSTAASARWNRPHSGNDANAMQPQCDSNANAMQKDANNLHTNLHTNIDNNNNIPPTADFVFEIFFFRNMKDPSGEVERFFKHYGDRNWTYQDGTPITNIEQTIRDWKPAKAGDRWNKDALNWYKAIYAAAAHSPQINPYDTFLMQLASIKLSGQNLKLEYKTPEAGFAVRDFISEHDLGGDWKIEYRVSN